jgi:integrase
MAERSRRGNQEGSIVQKPNGSWEARIKFPDEPKVRTKCFKKQKDARNWLDDTKAKKRMGLLASDTKTTVSEWLTKWLHNDAYMSVRTSTWESYESIIRNHIIPEIGNLQLSKLKAERIQMLYRAKSDTGRVDGSGGLSGTTVYYIHAVLHQALKRAVEFGILPKNEADIAKKPKKAKHSIKPLTKDEMLRFLHWAKEAQYYPLFL